MNSINYQSIYLCVICGFYEISAESIHGCKISPYFVEINSQKINVQQCCYGNFCTTLFMVLQQHIAYSLLGLPVVTPLPACFRQASTLRDIFINSKILSCSWVLIVHRNLKSTYNFYLGIEVPDHVYVSG